MEDAGVLVDNVSPTITIILGIIMLIGSVLFFSWVLHKDKKSGMTVGSAEAWTAVLVSFVLTCFGILFGGLFDHARYSSNALPQVEQHYGVTLTSPDDDAKLAGLFGISKVVVGEDDEVPVIIEHQGQVHEQARLHRNEEGDYVRFVLMLDPEPSSAEEFNAGLALNADVNSDGTASEKEF